MRHYENTAPEEHNPRKAGGALPRGGSPDLSLRRVFHLSPILLARKCYFPEFRFETGPIVTEKGHVCIKVYKSNDIISFVIYYAPTRLHLLLFCLGITNLTVLITKMFDPVSNMQAISVQTLVLLQPCSCYFRRPSPDVAKSDTSESRRGGRE